MVFTKEDEEKFRKRYPNATPITREGMNNGATGMAMHKRPFTGAFTPQPGYYYVEEAPPFLIYADTGENPNGRVKANCASTVKLYCEDHRLINRPIYARYNAKSPENFTDEIILIEGKFLYNKNSNGPKSQVLQSGMILHISDTKLVEDVYNGESYQTYSVTWSVEY